MDSVLVVEDNKTIALHIMHRIEEELHLSAHLAVSKAETEVLLKKETFFIALADLTLPDATGTSIIRLLEDAPFPTIVFTASHDDVLRDEILKSKVMDYILKDTSSALDYALRLVQLKYLNSKSSVLIVDDSKISRMFIKNTVERLRMKVLEASDGKEALSLISMHPEIKLVITDKEMPNVDGIKLVEKIRTKRGLNDLAIIGISSSNENDVTMQFLKAGANDFIKKPITPEELFVRVVTNIEMLDYIKIAKESSIRDYLTGLHNRMYLFDTGEKLFQNAKRKHLGLVVAMIDVDHFKVVNDKYGHYAGDQALKRLAEILLKQMRSADIVARYGGEEFCIIMNSTNFENARIVLEKIRQSVESTTIVSKEIRFNMTISIGINTQLESTLELTIDRADKALYIAKENGRNQVSSY